MCGHDGKCATALLQRKGERKNERKNERKDDMIETIREELFRMQDREYRDFQMKLIPTREADSAIGVRTPALRAYAKKLVKDEGVEALGEFLQDLPHKYFDEDQLHAFILSEMKDYEACIGEVERFLPFVDNWATCDQMSPKIFKKNRAALLGHIKKWIRTKKTYTVRFAIGMLMEHFLDGDFDPKYLQMVAQVRSEEYYVNMMIAWYFATALAKQYEATIPILEAGAKASGATPNRKGATASAAPDSKSAKASGPSKAVGETLVLSPWVQNKTIQKACESYRVSDEQKTYLRTLKIPRSEC